MSVILGVKTSNVIILAGDKRGSDKQGNILRNDLVKVDAINNHLGIASAGSKQIGDAILMSINKLDNKSNLRVENVIDIIRKLYDSFIEKELKYLMSQPASFLIGGLKRNDEIGLFIIVNSQGDLDVREVEIPLMIVPPDDVDIDTASKIFATNFNINPERFIEKTIADISDISKLVSSDGDKWIYDSRSNLSKSEKILGINNEHNFRV